MRISDWSSDVCSSVLSLSRRCVEGGGRVGLRRHLCCRGIGRHRARPAGGGADHGGNGLWLPRSEERRVGKESVSTCRSRLSPDDYKQNDLHDGQLEVNKSKLT